MTIVIFVVAEELFEFLIGELRTVRVAVGHLAFVEKIMQEAMQKEIGQLLFLIDRER